jgi:hydrogenase small subunit
MPGFPDKFMPFMDEPPGARLSTLATASYGTVIRALRAITNSSANREPKWRHKGDYLTTGYETTEYGKDGHNGHRH